MWLQLLLPALFLNHANAQEDQQVTTVTDPYYQSLTSVLATATASAEIESLADALNQYADNLPKVYYTPTVDGTVLTGPIETGEADAEESS